MGRFSIACSFRNVSVDFQWAYAGVYGPNHGIDSRVVWDELARIMSWWENHSVFGVILMLFHIFVRDQEIPVVL